MNDLLDQTYYNNTVQEYVSVIGIIIVGILLVLLLKRFIIKRLQAWAAKTPGTWDDFIVDSLARFGVPVLMWTVVYSVIHLLEFTEKGQRVVQIVTSIVVTYYILRLLSSVAVVLLKSGIRRRGYGEEKIKQLGGLIMIINAIIWIMGLVFLLGNWGIEVTPIIAGLGIGGIAVALAAQNILGDVFNYFVIFFDRPFEAGDFIIVGDMLGTVEYVGIKTTQIRSLGGEQIIIGNANLTSSRIHNYKRMLQRRVVFSINVQYGTPRALIEQIPGILKTIVERQPRTRFDRAHFMSYNDWSLRFEVVYYVFSADFNAYADTQQAINLAIYEEFERLKVNFAIPTQSLHIKADASEIVPFKNDDKT